MRETEKIRSVVAMKMTADLQESRRGRERYGEEGERQEKRGKEVGKEVEVQKKEMRKGARRGRGKEKGMRSQKGDRWLCLSGLLPLWRRRRGWAPL